MGALTRLGHLLADRIDRRDSIPFTASTDSPLPRALSTPAADSRAVTAAGPAGETTGSPRPVVAGRDLHPAGWAGTTRPGTGLHATDCLYLDDPGHRCVNESGQPTNQACIASWYQRNRTPKEVA